MFITATANSFFCSKIIIIFTKIMERTKSAKLKKRAKNKSLYPWHIYISLSLDNVYKNEYRPYKLCPLSRTICDERDKENSRFDLACGAHECLRSTPRGMQMCHGLRQAAWPHAVRSGAGGKPEVASSARCTASYLEGRPNAVVVWIYG